MKKVEVEGVDCVSVETEEEEVDGVEVDGVEVDGVEVDCVLEIEVDCVEELLVAQRDDWSSESIHHRRSAAASTASRSGQRCIDWDTFRVVEKIPKIKLLYIWYYYMI